MAFFKSSIAVSAPTFCAYNILHANATEILVINVLLSAVRAYKF